MSFQSLHASGLLNSALWSSGWAELQSNFCLPALHVTLVFHFPVIPGHQKRPRQVVWDSEITCILLHTKQLHEGHTILLGFVLGGGKTQNEIRSFRRETSRNTRRFLNCMYGIFCKYAEVRCSGLCALRLRAITATVEPRPIQHLWKIFNQKLSPGKRGIETAMLSRLLKKLGRSSVAQPVTEMWPFWNI